MDATQYCSPSRIFQNGHFCWILGYRSWSFIPSDCAFARICCCPRRYWARHASQNFRSDVSAKLFKTRVRTSKLHLSNCDWKTLETATARRPRSHHSIWSWRLETQATCFWWFPCMQPSKLAVQSPLRQSEAALKPEPRTGCCLASFATLFYIFCRAVGCLSCLPLGFGSVLKSVFSIIEKESLVTATLFGNIHCGLSPHKIHRSKLWTRSWRLFSRLWTASRKSSASSRPGPTESPSAGVALRTAARSAEKWAWSSSDCVSGITLNIYSQSWTFWTHDAIQIHTGLCMQVLQCIKSRVRVYRRLHRKRSRVLQNCQAVWSIWFWRRLPLHRIMSFKMPWLWTIKDEIMKSKIKIWSQVIGCCLSSCWNIFSYRSIDIWGPTRSWEAWRWAAQDCCAKKTWRSWAVDKKWITQIIGKRKMK